METGTEHGAPYPHGTAGAEQVKAKASELTQTARRRAMTTLDQQKTQVCDLLDRVAENIEDDRIGRHAAEYARRGSSYLRGRSADEIFDSVRAELRARPGVLLSACFVAGLAIARVMRGAGDRDGERAQGAWREDEASRWPQGPHGQPPWRGDEP
jgi:hypothetical protein